MGILRGSSPVALAIIIFLVTQLSDLIVVEDKHRTMRNQRFKSLSISAVE